ncbi:PTS mannose transporter subunit IIA [Lactobacillus sp. ESL0684]|uniref:PTS sugar transporter subunit IIA n=1 Tax=unclassified Lactobacillus TaxID=2620435 RepID=UPI0023F77435|nr:MULTISPECIES: PTS mannose transporter subunit IIA [unclassified Lactobacillus]WEV40060.1 PTS mannose transporter subunit IIA [Lactobacillus sp. ESL0681]WEV43400.1 PTS mannose transporter subunit IIA [Lactobacillus sp. ESL0684]
MKDIVLATHGNLSSEFKKTAELIVGKVPNVHCFGMTKEKSTVQAKAELEAIIGQFDESNLLVLTDLFGGSANNICTELLLQGHKFTLLTGLNLPMLLTLLTSDSDNITTAELVRQIVAAAQSGVVDVSNRIIEESEK